MKASDRVVGGEEMTVGSGDLLAEEGESYVAGNQSTGWGKGGVENGERRAESEKMEGWD